MDCQASRVWSVRLLEYGVLRYCNVKCKTQHRQVLIFFLFQYGAMVKQKLHIVTLKPYEVS